MFSEGVSRSQIPSQRQLELEALPPEYSARLSRRGVTVKSLYKEYHKTRPNGYKHASFGNYLMRYRMVTHVVGHIEHYADDQIYIDFASDKFEVIDNENGVSIRPRACFSPSYNKVKADEACLAFDFIIAFLFILSN